MKIVIPSHKRAGIVTTHNHIANCLVCVPESQRATYERFHPSDSIVTHPDSVVGLSPKRQWILDTFAGDDVVMVDDDSVGLNRLYVHQQSRPLRMQPEEAYNVIASTCETAKEVGAFMFGFCKLPSPTYYNSWKPYRFGPYTYASLLGFVKGHKLHFPVVPKFVHQDDWICLLNAYRHRYMFLDMRFHLVCHGYQTRPGGLQAEGEGKRTDESKRLSRSIILNHFGSFVWRQNDKGLHKVRLPYSV